MPINKDTPTSEIIDDFVHSKNPKFAGKSKADRVKQAVAASYKIHKEEAKMVHSVHVRDYGDDHNAASQFQHPDFDKTVKAHGGDFHYHSDKGVAFKFEHPHHARAFAGEVNRKFKSLDADTPEHVHEEAKLNEGDPIVRTKSFPGEPPVGTYADMRRKGTLPKPIQAKDKDVKEEVEISEKVEVTIKKQTSDEPNVSQRHVTYDVYHDGKYHKTFNDINDAMDHKEKMHLDEKVSPEMKQKIKDRMAALRTQDTKERHKIAKKQYERAGEQVEESKNTPYVRPYNNEQGQPAGWKAMNKHGKTKWFGIEFKPAAQRHAGLTEDTHQLDEALGRPPKAKGYTINPVNKQKLHHDNPEHMDLIRKLRKNGHLPPVDSAPKEHIINRLRQARTNMQGGQDITYENGKTHHVPSSMAAKTLDKYNGMKPADKEEFQAKIHRSHEDHKEAIKEEFMSEKKLTPKQKENLDKNHNGKIDKEDFIMLQKMKKEELMLQFAAALEEGIFDESDIDRLVENELAELDEAKTKPKGKPKPAFTEPKSMKEEVEGLNEEPKMTAHTAAGRYHAVESAVRDIMAKNQDMRKLNQEETFKRNNPDRFKD